MNSNPLIILAVYWNERYFIEPSLKQIESLNPAEVIICDGCFNPKLPNYSTDGTREIIEKFVQSHSNIQLTSALRPGILKSIWFLLKGHRYLPWWTMFRFSRLKFLIVSIFRVPYQRNEGLTFQHMISLSKYWKPGMWFMTYDADQFYSDEMIAKIKETIQDSNQEADLLIGKEMTFFKDFNHFTVDYEKRVFSNMPHKIYKDTNIQPQRSQIRETKSKGIFMNLRDILAKHLYFRFAKTKDVGFYFHYKLNPPERKEAGYKVGNRNKPNPSDYPEQEFSGQHPLVIKNYFNIK